MFWIQVMIYESLLRICVLLQKLYIGPQLKKKVLRNLHKGLAVVIVKSQLSKMSLHKF